jgi:hypothetical protein
MLSRRRRATFQATAKYYQVLDEIDSSNPAEMFVSATQWHALLDCVPPLRLDRGKDDDGTPLLIVKDDYGMVRTFRLKAPAGEPKGTVDLTKLLYDADDSEEA